MAFEHVVYGLVTAPTARQSARRSGWWKRERFAPWRRSGAADDGNDLGQAAAVADASARVRTRSSRSPPGHARDDRMSIWSRSSLWAGSCPARGCACWVVAVFTSRLPSGCGCPGRHQVEAGGGSTPFQSPRLCMISSTCAAYPSGLSRVHVRMWTMVFSAGSSTLVTAST